MNLLIDAQVPRLLAVRLRELGHDASHTLDLENGNRTSDQTISKLKCDLAGTAPFHRLFFPDPTLGDQSVNAILRELPRMIWRPK